MSIYNVCTCINTYVFVHMRMSRNKQYGFHFQCCKEHTLTKKRSNFFVSISLVIRRWKYLCYFFLRFISSLSFFTHIVFHMHFMRVSFYTQQLALSLKLTFSLCKARVARNNNIRIRRDVKSQLLKFMYFYHLLY